MISHALAAGADTLVTDSGLRSNHTRQTAVIAAHLGLKCVLIQTRWAESGDPNYERLWNLQLSRLMGAEVRIMGKEEAGGAHERVLSEVCQADV